jgi:hypothetical protein
MLEIGVNYRVRLRKAGFTLRSKILGENVVGFWAFFTKKGWFLVFLLKKWRFFEVWVIL